MRQLLVATRNQGKTREFIEILGDQFVVRDLSAELELPAVEETGTTFAENAILKAVAASKHFPGTVVADDSGLEVVALKGAPGVHSARYAGTGASDKENVVKLLAGLEASSQRPPYSARFRCVLALAREGVILGTVEGVVEGTIVASPRGMGGFGYDPVFQPAGSPQTFGQLSPEEKNRISHRARAIQSLRARLLS
jgi:XTP/dITP diphosphohydrolase